MHTSTEWTVLQHLDTFALSLTSPMHLGFSHRIIGGACCINETRNNGEETRNVSTQEATQCRAASGVFSATLPCRGVTEISAYLFTSPGIKTTRIYSEYSPSRQLVYPRPWLPPPQGCLVAARHELPTSSTSHPKKRILLSLPAVAIRNEMSCCGYYTNYYCPWEIVLATVVTHLPNSTTGKPAFRKMWLQSCLRNDFFLPTVCERTFGNPCTDGVLVLWKRSCGPYINNK